MWSRHQARVTLSVNRAGFSSYFYNRVRRQSRASQRHMTPKTWLTMDQSLDHMRRCSVSPFYALLLWHRHFLFSAQVCCCRMSLERVRVFQSTTRRALRLFQLFFSGPRSKEQEPKTEDLTANPRQVVPLFFVSLLERSAICLEDNSSSCAKCSWLVLQYTWEYRANWPEMLATEH